jgi:hypothetical protein
MTPEIASGAQRTNGFPPPLAVVFVILAAFIVWILALGRPAFPLDDAYITLSNARDLLEGRDGRFGVSPLVGATSMVHLALVATLASVVPLAWAGAIAAWIAIAAYALGLARLAQRCDLTSVETLLLVCIGLFAGFTLLHVLNGLETGLAMAFVLWALVLAMGPPTSLLPALLGLMPFVRPELAILAAFLFVDQARRRWSERAWAGVAADIAILAACAAPWLLWMWTETGGLLPQTVAAKRAFFAEERWPWYVKLRVVAHALGRLFLQVGPLAIAIVGLRGRVEGRLALLFAFLMLALFAQQFPGGLNHNEQRYLYVLVPLLLAGLAFALQAAKRVERRWLRWLAAASAAYALAFAPGSVRLYATCIEFARTELDGVTQWTNANLPADARVAVHDAGYAAFAIDRPLIDVVGLKTPRSREIHERITAPSAGWRRGEALAQVLAESEADYLIVWTGWDRAFALLAGLRAAGVFLEPVRAEGAYRVYRIVGSG